RVPEDTEAVRIGNPIANTGVHIVSAAGDPLPPGVVGELWISGAGLADGYWRNTELTRERFADLKTTDGAVRAYRTGDLARWRDDGTLECLGRIDGQIKIRGFRVELGEIDAALGDHPQVSLARCALRGAPGSERIVAWVTTNDGSLPDAVDLRKHLAERLPAYMLPADIGVIDRFPLNASGKTDVSSLPDPLAPAREVSAPASGTEERLLAIWRELLERPVVHSDDDWFHIGGHSLLALRMFSRIHRELGAHLPFSALLEHPTPRQLAAAIERSQNP
ncbi:MAG: non-ribosomal peptide synthetase, partial [Verrucomicrobiae bacterium]|nr:non-ribosomal peptide synthetase [Verrucomicrobiae bacterium]